MPYLRLLRREYGLQEWWLRTRGTLDQYIADCNVPPRDRQRAWQFRRKIKQRSICTKPMSEYMERRAELWTNEVDNLALGRQGVRIIHKNFDRIESVAGPRPALL
jgi:hypothetical protein